MVKALQVPLKLRGSAPLNINGKAPNTDILSTTKRVEPTILMVVPNHYFPGVDTTILFGGPGRSCTTDVWWFMEVLDHWCCSGPRRSWTTDVSVFWDGPGTLFCLTVQDGPGTPCLVIQDHPGPQIF